MAVFQNETGILYAGTGFTVTCVVTLDAENETVTADWSGLDNIPEVRYSTTPFTRLSVDSYSGSIIISPLSDQDNMNLTCTASIFEGDEIHATNSSSVGIEVVGKL